MSDIRDQIRDEHLKRWVMQVVERSGDATKKLREELLRREFEQIGTFDED